MAVLCLCQPCRADDAIDRYVRHELEAQHIPGVSVAVVKAGHVVKAEGYGVENVEQGTPATAESVYRIASLTNGSEAVRRICDRDRKEGWAGSRNSGMTAQKCFAIRRGGFYLEAT